MSEGPRGATAREIVAIINDAPIEESGGMVTTRASR